ncbi:hypothetical protein QON05_003080 [Salmonella enterica]|uniref:hypothetical protein n=1 Tax=Salmonella enterica TaxID=28901 RepID=UPI001CBDE202|nr:hypothetical protein [Salmonella enterica]EDR5915590.1 hypothetical protein [Salmonella enterica subsp. diarizonae]EKQ9927954.1 hypothetical protein [Salmonella enterica subsp. enterica serovar Panama]EGN5725844.1 hypothetical protein [Salmonella enterica]EJC4647724.1 hypothetical protein [Salmonella enterica]EJJ8331268.1 hypothetical protein [Salmonella enterica]
MTPTDFIQKHITEALVAEGSPDQVAAGGGQCGRRLLPAQFTGKPEGKHVR